jgi:hypothetical protein
MKTILGFLLVGLALPVCGAITNPEISVSIAVPFAPNRLWAFGHRRSAIQIS